jgi:hypothetical protein
MAAAGESVEDLRPNLGVWLGGGVRVVAAADAAEDE